MRKISEGDLVIAICDAPLLKDISIRLPSMSGCDRVYYRGDKFKVYRESIEDSSGLRLIILHPKFGPMDVTRINFELFSEYRENKLSNILDN